MQPSRRTFVRTVRGGLTPVGAVALLSALLLAVPPARANGPVPAAEQATAPSSDVPAVASPETPAAIDLAAPGTLEVIPIEEIEPGLTGYGYTVFSGREPERFEAEVVGVMRNAAPGTSYILARLSGRGLEKTGVAGGMSGSPVWIDGRLAGAVSFGWPFAHEAIAGITPIEDMREIAVAAAGPASAAPAAAASSPPSPPVGLERLAAADLPHDLLERELARLRPTAGAGAAGAVPGIQWSTLGFGAESEALLRRGLGTVAPAGEAASSQPADPPLVRGGAVAAVLVDGDLRLAATGTVTDILGDRVLAFGHPFLGLGPVSLPMASAEVVTVLSNAYSSFKISNLGPVVGAFREDRQAGILGRLGETAPTIPLTLRVAGGAETPPREFRMRLAEVPQMTPVLLAISTLAGLDAATRAGGSQGLDLAARFRLAGHPDLEVRQSFDGDGAGLSSAIYLLSFAGYLLQNELAEVDIEAIEIDLVQSPRPRVASLVGVNAERTVVRPGDPVRLNLDFTAWRGDTFRRTVEVRVPEDAPSGAYHLFVGDGPSVDAARLSIERAAPVNIRQALELMRSFHSRSDLLVMGVAPGSGLTVAGEVMPNLPGSVRSIWSAASSGSAVPLRLAVVQQDVEPMGVPVEGLVRVDLRVERREPLTRETADSGPAEDGEEPGVENAEEEKGGDASEASAAPAATPPPEAG